MYFYILGAKAVNIWIKFFFWGGGCLDPIVFCKASGVNTWTCTGTFLKRIKEMYVDTKWCLFEIIYITDLWTEATTSSLVCIILSQRVYSIACCLLKDYILMMFRKICLNSKVTWDHWSNLTVNFFWFMVHVHIPQ